MKANLCDNKNSNNMKITVIIVALNESEFIKPCIKAIYPFVDRIKVQTNYDRSWAGEFVSPDKTVEKILEIPDQQGKISLHISRLPDEAIARNWLMRSDGYLLDHLHTSTTSNREQIEEFCEKSDYFWIIDGDEIYDPETIPNIIDYLDFKKPKILKIRGINYFKTWNYRIFPEDMFFQPGFIKPGVLFSNNRNLVFPLIYRIIKKSLKNKHWSLKFPSERVFSDVTNLSDKIGVFHHGCYVGDDGRMAKKVFFSGHYNEKMKDWYENVWKNWRPEYKNLHPLYPELFQGVKHVPTEQLPRSIRDEHWPQGYLN